ncbi:cyclin-T1-4 isoform X1 [Beta vulgaris subsp. vulgaris]|uniref:cyclin-T1-4 isoform X1 n=1 Tax=Beta vulgaris subsp. vulgaris TaxID=3555 RepID=UPI0020366FED|nr:cyclin-T1-4 isoform X1 [Beta vulgaris subsp. vulgaris]
MSYGRTYQPQGGTLFEYHWPSFPRNHDNHNLFQNDDCFNYNRYNHYGSRMFDDMKKHDLPYNALVNCRQRALGENFSRPHGSSSFKRRKFSENFSGGDGAFNCQPIQNGFLSCIPSNDCIIYPSISAPSTSAHCYTLGKRGRSDLEDEDCTVLMSREEIERCSPSRKDGIDALHETRLRYSYCAFIQNLGMRLDVPQTTIGTAMVLCHRFFIRRSHACHDRFLIATAALFLAAKSEETGRPLNDVVKASCEIIHKQDLSILSYMLPIDWFEQYRERIIEAEQLILTTLNFELDVEHPFDTLTSILNKLGVSQTHLMDVAIYLISEGFRSSLWLQFKPQQIAAGVAYLASKMLNMNFDSLSIWREFQTPPAVLQDVAQQLMELYQN